MRSGLFGPAQDDIIAELSENLRSRIDDLEGELGRPLTEPELESLQAEFGHPLMVAGRYQTDRGTLTFGRELIGPELFPYYMLALKYILGITAAAVILVMSGLALANPSRWPELFPALGFHLGLQFTILTLIWMGVRHTKRGSPGAGAPMSEASWPPLGTTSRSVSRASRPCCGSRRRSSPGSTGSCDPNTSPSAPAS